MCIRKTNWLRLLFFCKLALILAVCFGSSSCSSGATGCDCSGVDPQCGIGTCDRQTKQCITEAINEGVECDDHDWCTQGDTCQSGICVGTAIDCSEQEDECNLGVCERGNCKSVPRPDGTECISQSDECHDGGCEQGACVGQAKANLTPCNDGDWCTDPDACTDGVCIGPRRTCDDGLDCTEDICDPDRNSCDHQVTAGWCYIAGVCYAEGEPNPGNSCQSCLSSTSSVGWTNDDLNQCDDGNRCTDQDRCAAGVCLGTPLPACCLTADDCSDGKGCTDDVCEVSSGICSNSIVDGYCLIGGACYSNGTLNPADPCQECQGSTSRTSWTNNTNSCNDGRFCTSDDRCSDGACQGTYGVVCDDGLACTEDTCSETQPNCSQNVLAGNCLIDGVCYLEGVFRSDHPCQKCDSSLSRNGWSNLLNGTTCDDGSFCNDGEACNNGVCEGGTARNCEDGLACSTNTCNEAASGCDTAINAGWCIIGNNCYQEGAPSPSNPCQECKSVVSQTAWTNDDTNSCDDGNFCTTGDRCLAGACQGSNRDCEDGIGCTTDSCNAVAQQCDHLIDAGNCLIGNICYPEGTPNPVNLCQECRSALRQTDWTNDDANSCNDGNICTDPDFCSAGVCTGTPVPSCCTGPADCDDGNVCTDNLCNIANGTCSNPITNNWCFIGGVCYAEGAADPNNSCQVCVSATSNLDWTSRSNGSACDDGLFCTDGEICNTGVCGGGQAHDCSDGLSCTEDICNEGNNTCGHQLLNGRCLIGGTCYLDAEANPANNCLVCTAAANQTSWSPKTNGAECGGVCQWCQNGSCENIPNAVNLDPFLECATCRVCNGSGGCRQTGDGTDPKNECTLGDCTYDSCQSGSCNRPAGTPCLDLSPGNCKDAQCNGLASCVQDYAPEAGGGTYLCRSADGLCDVPEYCDGVSLDCPPDLVKGTSVECRAAAGECDLADFCDGATKSCPTNAFVPAGAQCTDASSQDCNDAQCNGLGVCLQNYAFEAPGHLCDDGDPCTASDQCNAFGLCLGIPVAAEPNPGSPVSATSSCLTANTGALSVLRLDLKDLGNNAIPGAVVTIEADNPAATWTGVVTESTSRPGTYYRILRAPTFTGSTVVRFTAMTGSGACLPPPVAMSGTVTIRFSNSVTGNTGGCNPIDNNLRIKVVSAELGTPIANAYVMLGGSEASSYRDNYETILAGGAPNQMNTDRTDANGFVEFVDHGLALEGPQLVTAGFEGRSYLTLVEANASDLVLPLAAITNPPPSSKLDGVLTNIGASNYDGRFDAGFVMPEFSIESLAKLKFDDLLASQRDCWLATDAAIIGTTWVEMPVNIFVPQQRERYMIFVDVPIYQHNYITKPIPNGSANHHIVGISGAAPFADLVGALMGGASLADIVPLLNTRKIGVILKTINGDEHNVPIDLTTNLNANVTCAIQNKPAGADSLCVTIGDWNGTHGDGPMFLMGFRFLSAGQGTVTTVPSSGGFAGIGYLGMGVATFLDTSTLPPADQWKKDAASSVMDRSGTSFGGTGGSLLFDDFLEITPLTRAGRTYSWNSVATMTPVDYTEHNLDLVNFISYIPSPGGCTNLVDEEIWRNTYWRILTPAGTQSFTLPTLPAGWPRQADGGLATPVAGEYLNWSFSAYFLGLLSGGFDFNAFNFASITQNVSHSSTNNVDF